MKPHAASRWPPRTLRVSLSAALALVLPALAAAASSGGAIHEGLYTPFKGPATSYVRLAVRAHSIISPVTLTCAPGSSIASVIAQSDTDLATILPVKSRLSLHNGNFAYSGKAVVDAGGPPALAKTTLTLHGRYVAHGAVIRYKDDQGDPATATLTFRVTAASPACAHLPHNGTFSLYRLYSPDDSNPVP